MGYSCMRPGGIDVQVGDVVRALGTVAEYAGSGVTSTVTELTGVTDLLICGTATVPAPTVLTLPVTAISDFEPYEGMLVTFPQTLYISEYFNFDRFGEIVLTTERHIQPTANSSRDHWRRQNWRRMRWPDDARRWSCESESGSGDPSEWARVHARQPVPWW